MTATRRSTKAKVLGRGPDGRAIYTADRDARAGHRSATNTRPAGTYVGRELHLGVAVPALIATDTTTWSRFGPDVPHVVVTVDLVPAGSHPGHAVRESLLAAAQADLCHDVVFDAGYSLKRPETLLTPLAQAGVDVTLRPASYQTGERGTIGDARVIDGQLFSWHLPDSLRSLALPGQNTTAAERERSMELFERRAAYRYGRIKAPGADGITRWENPLHAGRIRSRAVPRSMRGPVSAPLVTLRTDRDAGARTVSVGADQLPLMQPTMVGTRAWHQAYGRRNLAETVNALLHGGYTEIDKGYVRMVNSGRISTMVSYTIAGLNRSIVRTWMRIRRLLDPSHPDALPPEPARWRRPRHGRLHRYQDLIPRGTSPPG